MRRVAAVQVGDLCGVNLVYKQSNLLSVATAMSKPIGALAKTTAAEPYGPVAREVLRTIALL